MDDDLIISRNPLPVEIDERLAAQLTFIAEADRLKNVFRASTLAAADRKENDAEHSWHLALMVMLLAEYADEPIDTAHALKLVLIHDLVEVYAGDSPVFDLEAVVSQLERETAAADTLFRLLPSDQAVTMLALWDEFEAGASAEARFGRAVDRLEPLLLNWLNRGGTWLDPGVTEAMVRARKADIATASRSLAEATDLLIETALRQGWIRTD